MGRVLGISIWGVCNQNGMCVFDLRFGRNSDGAESGIRIKREYLVGMHRSCVTGGACSRFR